MSTEKTNEIIEVKVKVYQKQTKEGKKFLTYKAVKKDGYLITCKFRKAVIAPTENCILLVKKSNINVNTSKEYPECWVKEIEGTKPLEAEAVSSKLVEELF